MPAAPTPRRRPTAVPAGLGLILAGLLALGGCSQGSGTAAPDRSASASATSTTAPTREATATATADPATSATPTVPADVPTDVPTDEAAGEPTDAPTGAPTDEAEGHATEPPADADAGPTPAPTERPDPTADYLRPGSSGERVSELQQALVDLGYRGTGVDGSFGAGTTQAVWALQKAAGLARDGVVGPATLAAVEDGVRPKARSTSGHVLEFDVARQLVLLVDDGTVGAIMNASSGNGDEFEAKGHTYWATTPTGSYAVGRQVDGNYASGLELGDMYRPKFFNGGIAVHGSPSVPAWPASHGCVRVTNASINYIWDVWGAPPGTRVLVY
ncbi:peptidoglycan hydrolase-like protein with peptidoglycan-binding domain [Sediminihabitans luteus]|uniref:Peptidoglycan hydrolase-like protein with peptidoglycan-binding domain n=1 Tax=Sediminihabitans luteus TaxID=1138585 RepID=A0A2M9CZE0_9CELL|nr:L,D-transpeptidase family protein [Sediminihabitans luteus]PJJ77289.1 peptidoglycan hydrolase-like protein with peptidoglycan-binding domain [Sediminihabitans luteus]GII98739.1 hypothetical protein Slu03_11170 [Sediminihabitans luteus]